MNKNTVYNIDNSCKNMDAFKYNVFEASIFKSIFQFIP